MRVVYVIGNGFDINLGLNTRYRDFYEYFKSQHSKSELIEQMKTELDSETWADLELALGRFTAKFNSPEEFQEVYYEISDKLTEHIRSEEQKLELSEEKKQKIRNDLIAPESYFKFEIRRFITEYKSQQSIQRSNSQYIPWVVNIINFNYSKTLERLLDFKARRNYELGNNPYQKPVYLSEIAHIHGIADIDETILLGVNDTSQVANESFHEDVDFLDLIIKPQTNRGSGEGIDADCAQFLQNANLICIFGSSIGETDKVWWNLLGEQLRRDDCRIIYFVKEEKSIPGNRKQLMPRKIREWQNYLLSRTSLSSTEQEHVRNKIWVGHNTEMFKLD